MCLGTINISAATTASSVWSGSLNIISFLVFRSVSTSNVFFDFPRLPKTLSISQLPNSSRVSISFGRLSILSPAAALFCCLCTFL